MSTNETETLVSNEEIVSACAGMKNGDRLTFTPDHTFAWPELATLAFLVNQGKKEAIFLLIHHDGTGCQKIDVSCYAPE